MLTHTHAHAHAHALAHAHAHAHGAYRNFWGTPGTITPTAPAGLAKPLTLTLTP